MTHYVPRHGGRHRKPRTGLRLPAALTTGYALPTAAAATLLATASGAAMAQPSNTPSDAAPMAAGSSFASVAQAEDARATVAATQAVNDELDARRSAATSATAALQGRQQERERVARTKAREARQKAAAKAAARARAAAKAAAAAEAERRKLAKNWTSAIPGGAPLTSGFGYRWGRLHAGVDYGAATGTPLVAMSSGTVTYAGWMSGYGNMVEIRYHDGTVSRYGHMNSISVGVGQQVMRADGVGTVGNTGRSFGSHLHLEIRPGGGAPVNPLPWLAAHGL
ncbi:M23 family metallopeptidase [Kribbia dieselivorans]|uniref:M23 family metallopeptidase n=1 Tax=Kribbia dieselivorans TaxID=331526 RepID=UPI000838F2D2|nr:M23 family metallopeptidase [Kribbia dieselivorans]